MNDCGWFWPYFRLDDKIAPALKTVAQGTNAKPSKCKLLTTVYSETVLRKSDRIITCIEELLTLYLIITLWFCSRLFMEVNAYCAVENICGGSRVISVC